MNVKIEGLSPAGPRVPLKLEGGRLMSLCMEVSREACVIITAPARCRLEARSVEIRLTEMGYRRIRLDLLPDPPPWLRGEAPLECHRCGSDVEPGTQLHPYLSDADPSTWCPPCAEAEVRCQLRPEWQRNAETVLALAVEQLGRSTTPEYQLPALQRAATRIAERVEQLNRGG